MAWPAVCATFLLFYTIINPQLFVLSVYVCSLSLFSDMFFTRSSKHLSTAHETTSDDGLALIELKKKSSSSPARFLDRGRAGTEKVSRLGWAATCEPTASRKSQLCSCRLDRAACCCFDGFLFLKRLHLHRMAGPRPTSASSSGGHVLGSLCWEQGLGKRFHTAG